jgi:hypothetical protein
MLSAYFIVPATIIPPIAFFLTVLFGIIDECKLIDNNFDTCMVAMSHTKGV